MYSEKVLDHFHHPRHVGEIGDASAVVETTNPVCGDTLKLWVKLEGTIVVQATFKAQGCVPAIACGSWLADWLIGKEICNIQSLPSGAIEASLGGMPPASRHAAALAAECLNRLLRRIC